MPVLCDRIGLLVFNRSPVFMGLPSFHLVQTGTILKFAVQHQRFSHRGCKSIPGPKNSDQRSRNVALTYRRRADPAQFDGGDIDFGLPDYCEEALMQRLLSRIKP